MIRLGMEASPTWLDLPHGVRVQVEPLTTALAAAARNEAIRRVAIEIDDARSMEKAGLPLAPGGFHAGNMAAVEGKATQYEIEALARFGIKAWEGIAGADGKPLAVAPEALEAFARHPEIGPAFRDAYRKSVEALQAEGEGSAPSSAIDGAGAPIIAPDARIDH